MKLFPSARPYWHVDAKWICGIFLVSTLSLALLLATALKITDEKRAPDIAALIIGKGFIRGNSIDTDAAKQELAKNGGTIHPLPNIPSVVITEADLNSSPQDISLKVFRPVTQIIYKDGIQGAADQLATSKEQKQKIIKDAVFLKPFTKQAHNALKTPLIILSVISIILVGAVVYFSAAWGRLSNIGFLLLMVSLPGTLASLILLHPPKNGPGGLGSLPLMSRELGSAFSEAYSKIVWLGAVLLIIALIGKIFSASKENQAKLSKEKTK